MEQTKKQNINNVIVVTTKKNKAGQLDTKKRGYFRKASLRHLNDVKKTAIEN